MWRRGNGLMVLLLASIGCGPSAPTGGSAAASPDVRHRTLESLPAVGEYLPPVDEGRLEAAPPAGWKVLPRGKTYLMGFAAGKPSELPRITIQADDAPPGAAGELTSDNAAEMAAHLDDGLRAAAKAGKKRVAEYSRPIILGETMYLRHVRTASLSDMPCVIQSLQTLKGGRLYTVELIAEIDAPRAEEYEPSLTRWRDQAYAVAAHLSFAPQESKLDALAKPNGATSSPQP